ncbi:MAG: hypothetical protein ACE145_19540 [Terriglobia bacterium]
MPELILSDITVMGEGYCVIGLEKVMEDSYRSLRPLPPRAFAWRDPFPFRRSDCVRYDAVPTTVTLPHVEDQQSRGLVHTRRSVSEQELTGCLRKAEVSGSLFDLFGCAPHASDRGGRALWVDPEQARRSICGCEYENIRFRVFRESSGFALRAEVVLKSGDRMSSLPIVDREWNRFVAHLVKLIQRSDPLPLAERFMNRTVYAKLLLSPARFARIGLPRPRADRQCWLMLDSLFPQPQAAWLELL